jgi:predicted nucleic acid-binding protein
MQRLVVDAGPLIGLFWSKDPDHMVCRTGLEQLAAQGTQLLTPVPVIFEVYKWLLYRASRPIALQALEAMNLSLQPVPLTLTDFTQLMALVKTLSGWNGSLEDAMVFWVAQEYRCPVWTLNYRDFAIFSALEFWTPMR